MLASVFRERFDDSLEFGAVLFWSFGKLGESRVSESGFGRTWRQDEALVTGAYPPTLGRETDEAFLGIGAGLVRNE